MTVISMRTGRIAQCSRPAFRQGAAPAPSRAVRLRAAPTKEVELDSKKSAEEHVFDDGPEVAPSTTEVTSFLTTLCDDTNIAEIAVEMGSFKLKVRRSIASGAAAAAPAAVAAPAAAAPAPPQIIARAPAVEEVVAEESMDEALVYVPSPKVGIFRRGKYAAGKRVGKGNVADEGSPVKMGQPLGYVEQLGTFVVVEAPQAGEVVGFVIKDGDAVEYKQTIVEMAPYFGGHIIGDSKYA